MGHKYNVDLNAGTVQLCLYKPGNKEWMKHYSIAKTIVPWAIEWLYYYEIWQITGDWQGGGAHPTPKACRNSDKYKEKIEDNEYLDFIVKSTESQIDNLSVFLEMVERDNDCIDEAKSKSDAINEEQYVCDSLTRISENLTQIKLSLPFDASEKEN